jgi:cytochrome c553
MKTSKTWLAVSLFVGTSLAASVACAQGGGSVEAGRTKAAACAGCHGPDGNSPADMWPKIAGQVSEYIVKQLQDFRDGRRRNDQMSPQARSLSDQDIRDLAAFYAAQRAKTGAGQPDKLAQGEKLYLKGAGRGPTTVTACLGCHGQSGEGGRNWSGTYAAPPTVLAPAIGSQHPAYVANQLKAYKAGARQNDVGQVMRNIASRMSEGEIEAVAQYVTTLSR